MARLAVDADVHVVGVSSLGGGHRNLVPDVVTELGKMGRSYALLIHYWGLRHCVQNVLGVHVSLYMYISIKV